MPPECANLGVDECLAGIACEQVDQSGGAVRLLFQDAQHPIIDAAIRQASCVHSAEKMCQSLSKQLARGCGDDRFGA